MVSLQFSKSIIRLFLSLLLFCPWAFSQELPIIAASTELKPGVVIEEVKKHWSADRAGLQPEDILVTWTRGGAQGRIESPFDLIEIENEQASRGAVLIQGYRGNQSKVWELGPAAWGIESRPNLANTLLAIYREGRRFAEIGKQHEAVKQW